MILEILRFTKRNLHPWSLSPVTIHPSKLPNNKNFHSTPCIAKLEVALPGVTATSVLTPALECPPPNSPPSVSPTIYIIAVSLDDLTALKTATLPASTCATGDSRPPLRQDPFLERIPLIDSIWAEETLTLENPLASVAQLEPTIDCQTITATTNSASTVAMEDESWSLFDGFEAFGQPNTSMDKIPAALNSTDPCPTMANSPLDFSDLFDEDRLGLALEGYMECNAATPSPKNQVKQVNLNESDCLIGTKPDISLNLRNEAVVSNDQFCATSPLQNLLSAPAPNKRRNLDLSLHSQQEPPKKLKLDVCPSLPPMNKIPGPISTPDVTNIVLELESGQNFDLLSYIDEDFDAASIANTDSGVNSPACSTSFSRPSSRAVSRRSRGRKLYEKDLKSPADLVVEARERNNEASRKSRQNKKKREQDNQFLIERLERENANLMEDEKNLQALIARVKKAMMEAVGNKPELMNRVQDLQLGSSFR